MGSHSWSYGDGTARDWYWVNSGGNGQDVEENFHGSILRIDVDHTDGDRAYGIPDSNPLVGRDGLAEHYAWGFRNPWRMSFDGENLLVGDVGESHYEEVNLVEAGGNYGWLVREGPSCTNRNGIVRNLAQPLNLLSDTALNKEPFPSCPAETPDGEPLREPVITYPGEQNLGFAVVGGYVHRNSTVSPLQDSYVFGDVSGRLYASPVSYDSDPPWPMQPVELAESETNFVGKSILSFARDSAGEIYVLTAGFREESGTVMKIV